MQENSRFKKDKKNQKKIQEYKLKGRIRELITKTKAADPDNAYIRIKK